MKHRARESWTGDLGCFDEGGFVYIKDRLKDVIIRGGENIFAAEVEARIETHAGVHEVAIVSMPSERYGEEVRAVVRLNPGVKLSQEVIQSWVGEALAPFKVPSIVEFQEMPLPRNAAGKLLKRVIKGDVNIATEKI